MPDDGHSLTSLRKQRMITSVYAPASTSSLALVISSIIHNAQIVTSIIVFKDRDKELEIDNVIFVWKGKMQYYTHA